MIPGCPFKILNNLFSASTVTYSTMITPKSLAREIKEKNSDIDENGSDGTYR